MVSKNEKQRQRLLDRFAKANLSTADYSTSASSSTADHSTYTSSLTADHSGSSNPLSLTNLPESVKSSMWAKVQSYMQDKSSYTKSPGISDYSSILVKSTSGNRPHFVQKTGANVYKCDHDCLMFKSTNGMCSHSLLAASLNDQTETFVRQYTKNKVPVNYANLAQHGLPVGGKKPSKRKASSKQTTSAVRKIIDGADDVVRSKQSFLLFFSSG